VALITRVLGTVPVGPYQRQAAIAAVHDEAPSAEDTDWPQILALYEVLQQVSPGPVVTLNRAVAVAMVTGRAPDSPCAGPSTRTTAWPAPTALTRCGDIRSSSPATRSPPGTATGGRRRRL
jgi:hypothetical protein